MPVKGLWKILHHWLLLAVDAELSAFSWPDCPPPLLLCFKAAEPRRHREDSPAGGRSHAIPPSRGPETGSLIDSSPRDSL